ncbi:unnamed protein product [Ceutorhynchus assimilis]|uniref:Tetratricopeptide repeat protein 18 n=1 Tax=Ceutorhynchus assimilis TaxID=467358 RepID=A0A9N9MPM1_9CUCU|nr:unnamed protein product [Ceutorhynchus assimilis]
MDSENLAKTVELLYLYISSTCKDKDCIGKIGKKDEDRKADEEISKSAASKDSKTTKTSKKTEPSENIPDIPIIKTEMYGLCVIDLIPLFHGETSFSETLIIKPINQPTSTPKNQPEISITIATKDNAKLINITNILYFTVESICNVPSLMLEQMDCTICVMLPLHNSAATPTIFHNPKITTREPFSGLEPKRWPGLHDVAFNANTTKYFIADSYEEITNKDNFNIKEAFKEGASRIEYNYLKRNVLYKSGKSELAAHISTHREIALEIFLTPASRKDKTFDEHLDRSSIRSTKNSPHLHLMAVIDVAALLYPGFSRLRIATPVKLFTYEEAAKTGLHGSFFLPKPSRDMPNVKALKVRVVDVSKKNKKSPEKKEKTPSKKDTKSLDSQQSANLEEPTQKICEQVYDEAGKPCFIIIEIELLNPLNPKIDIDELKTNLHSLQLDALQSSRSILSQDPADERYDYTIKEILDNLNQQWLEYNRVITTIPVPEFKMNFVEYLVRVGAYKSYTNSIITSVIYLMTTKYKCIEYYFKYHHGNYHNLLSELYAELIEKLHNTLNVMVCNEMRAKKVDRIISWDLSFFYAKEAAELKLYKLAERYFMDRIIVSNDTKENATFWFHFAIYNIEINNVEEAFRCVREAIALNCTCKYTLLLLGVLLAEKDNRQDAETCFLNTLILDPYWVAGWCILYCFYKKCDRPDGMEMALDMGKKLVKGYCSDKEHFETFEDLAWSWQNIPKSFFFNAAVLLLKMRLFSWVEMALAEILEPNNYGYVQYLLAIVNYYKKDFDHALECNNEAKASLELIPMTSHIFIICMCLARYRKIFPDCQFSDWIQTYV